MARSVDVLPAPLGPSRATASPAPTSRSIPSTARTAPYDTASPRTSSTSLLLSRSVAASPRREPAPRRDPVRSVGDAEVGVDDALVLPDGHRVALGDLVPELEDRDPSAQLRDEIDLVVDEEQRHPLLAHGDELAGQLLRLGRVEPGRRLVEQDD